MDLLKSQIVTEQEADMGKLLLRDISLEWMNRQTQSSMKPGQKGSDKWPEAVGRSKSHFHLIITGRAALSSALFDCSVLNLSSVTRWPELGIFVLPFEISESVRL